MSKAFQSPNLETKSVEELTSELLEAHSRLRTLQKEREMMLANISHDLRAPITAIRSAIDLALTSDNLSIDESRKLFSLIDRRTSSLEELINDMYYLFNVEDEARPLKIQSVDACTFLEEYYYDAIIDSRYDRFDMLLDVPADLNCVINIEPQKIVRVLDNLLTNAAKYAGEKATYIRLSAHIYKPSSKNNVENPSVFSPSSAQLIISVSDNGNGIAPEALPHIFTRTYTVSNARTPGETSGSGLGLSIARAIVERHGGTINAESTLGQGTTFTVSLPCFCSQS
ncbi:MAG: HAMP domain-containing histidine kinase [Lachnospiraceae bacterium]|nr:HAMP domain-containing histidine kinase [Lachnospiraceae bacterium]